MQSILFDINNTIFDIKKTPSQDFFPNPIENTYWLLPCDQRHLLLSSAISANGLPVLFPGLARLT